jgi:uncharacterized membrane protein
MNRKLLVLVGLLAVAALVINTGAFSSAAVTRNTSIPVSSDEDAMLGVMATDIEVAGDTDDVTLLMVTNHRSAPLSTVSVTVTEAAPDSAPSLSNVSTIVSLGPGESKSVTADIACASTAQNETVTMDVEASGQVLDIHLTRQIEVSCL